jgi:hypothetical protein
MEINTLKIKDEVVEGIGSFEDHEGMETFEFRQPDVNKEHMQNDDQHRYVENYLQLHVQEPSELHVAPSGSLEYEVDEETVSAMNQRCIKILQHLETVKASPFNGMRWHLKPDELREKIMGMSFFHDLELDSNLKRILISDDSLSGVSRAVGYVLQVFYSKSDLRNYYLPRKPTAVLLNNQNREPLPRFRLFYQIFADIFGYSAGEFAESEYCRPLFTSFTNGRSKLFATGFICESSKTPTKILSVNPPPTAVENSRSSQQATGRKRIRTYGQDEDYVADSSSGEEIDDEGDDDFVPSGYQLSQKRKRGRPPKRQSDHCFPHQPHQEQISFTVPQNTRDPNQEFTGKPSTASSSEEVPFTEEEIQGMRRRLEKLLKEPYKHRYSTSSIVWVTTEVEKRIYALDPFEDVDMNEMLQDLLLREDSRNSIARAVTNVAKVLWSAKVIRTSPAFRFFPHKRKFYDLFQFMLGYNAKQFRSSPEHNRMTVRLCQSDWKTVLYSD